MFGTKLMALVEKVASLFALPAMTEDLSDEAIAHYSIWNYYPYMV